MPHTIPVPQCPKCQGDMYDNRDSKKNPKSPDFRCKDKSCVDDKGFATALWERDILKKGGAAPVAPTVKQPLSSGGPLPWEDAAPDALPHEKLDKLFNLYDLCFAHMYSVAHTKLGNDASHEGISAMAATVFIAAKERGM